MMTEKKKLARDQQGKQAETVWDMLRKPFPEEVVGELPRGNITLQYVGHAAVTDRLNNVVGPAGWNWEPLAKDEFGLPMLDSAGNLWIKLTINGVSRLGYGDGSTSMKVLIGDALRNAAMRFGIALDLWSKDELESTLDDPSLKNKPPVNPPIKRPAGKPQPITAARRQAIAGLLAKHGVEKENMQAVLMMQYDIDDTDKMTEEDGKRVMDAIVKNPPEPLA